MSALRGAFRSGLRPPSPPSTAGAATRAQGVLEVGVGWVRDILGPEVDRANLALGSFHSLAARSLRAVKGD